MNDQKATIKELREAAEEARGRAIYKKKAWQAAEAKWEYALEWQGTGRTTANADDEAAITQEAHKAAQKAAEEAEAKEQAYEEARIREAIKAAAGVKVRDWLLARARSAESREEAEGLDPEVTLGSILAEARTKRGAKSAAASEDDIDQAVAELCDREYAAATGDDLDEWTHNEIRDAASELQEEAAEHGVLNEIA